jgi:hypothetical protein
MRNEEEVNKQLVGLQQKVAMIQRANLVSIEAKIRLARFKSQLHALEWVMGKEEMER